MRFASKDTDVSVRLLRSGRGIILAKRGCHACDVWRDIDDATLFHYIEGWKSEEDFHHHVRPEEFLRVLVAMDMCSEEPRILVGNLTGMVGMRYLRRLRDAGNDSPAASG